MGGAAHSPENILNVQLHITFEIHLCCEQPMKSSKPALERRFSCLEMAGHCVSDFSLFKAACIMLDFFVTGRLNLDRYVFVQCIKQLTQSAIGTWSRRC